MANAVSVFLVPDVHGFFEDLDLERFLTEHALELANLLLEITDFGGTDDLVVGPDGFKRLPSAMRRLQWKS